MEEKLIALFEAYSSNELSNSEKKAFEDKLNSDSIFKEDFELYITITKNLASRFANEAQEKELRKTLSTLQNQSKKQAKVVSLFAVKKLLVAASIILLVSLSVYNFMQKPSYIDFANYDDLSLVVRGSNEDDTQKKMLEKYFNNKQFNKALPLFESLLKDHPNDNKLILYKGLALLETNEISDAIILFDQLIEKNNPLYNDTATWYKALAYLKNKDYDSCKKELKNLNSDSDYSDDAKKLLKSL